MGDLPKDAERISTRKDGPDQTRPEEFGHPIRRPTSLLHIRQAIQWWHESATYALMLTER